MSDLALHSYWRSTAAYRVRIALGLKGIAVPQRPRDLLHDGQRTADYLALNPQGLVPALETGGIPLTQSLAIIEWLEETQPTPPLLPAGARARAQARAMALIVAADIHPLNNLRVLKVLRGDLGADEAQVSGWIARWIGEGFAALEALVARHGGACGFGDTPGIVDCCLIPQLYSARRFEVPLQAFPRLLAVEAACLPLPAFAAAHPDVQPDKPA